MTDHGLQPTHTTDHAAIVEQTAKVPPPSPGLRRQKTPDVTRRRPPRPTSSINGRAMCLIDFGLPVEQEESDMLNTQDLMARNLQKFNVKKSSRHNRKNFEVIPLENPVLFLAYTSKNSLCMVDKPWLQVVKSLAATPVHRHIFGT